MSINGYHYHPFDCNKYVYCDFNLAEERNCTNNLVYNLQKGRCVLRNDLLCANNSTSTVKSLMETILPSRVTMSTVPYWSSSSILSHFYGTFLETVLTQYSSNSWIELNSFYDISPSRTSSSGNITNSLHNPISGTPFVETAIGTDLLSHTMSATLNPTMQSHYSQNVLYSFWSMGTDLISTYSESTILPSNISNGSALNDLNSTIPGNIITENNMLYSDSTQVGYFTSGVEILSSETAAVSSSSAEGNFYAPLNEG